MCVCVCVRMCNIYICVNVRVCVCAYVYYIYMCECACVRVYIMYTCVSVRVCVCVYVRMCVPAHPPAYPPFSHADTNSCTAQDEGQHLRREFEYIMKERFLSGWDSVSFDYSSVDHDSNLDTHMERGE